MEVEALRAKLETNHQTSNAFSENSSLAKMKGDFHAGSLLFKRPRTPAVAGFQIERVFAVGRCSSVGTCGPFSTLRTTDLLDHGRAGFASRGDQVCGLGRESGVSVEGAVRHCRLCGQLFIVWALISKGCIVGVAGPWSGFRKSCRLP